MLKNLLCPTGWGGGHRFRRPLRQNYWSFERYKIILGKKGVEKTIPITVPMMILNATNTVNAIKAIRIAGIQPVLKSSLNVHIHVISADI